MDDISHKDVVITITGASAALSGLILVFLGVLIAALQDLIGEATDATLKKYKIASGGAFVVFLVSLVSVILDTAWLVASGGTALYVASLALFFAYLVGLLGLAWYSTFKVLLQG